MAIVAMLSGKYSWAMRRRVVVDDYDERFSRDDDMFE